MARIPKQDQQPLDAVDRKAKELVEAVGSKEKAIKVATPLVAIKMDGMKKILARLKAA
jgi:hypothetical protein